MENVTKIFAVAAGGAAGAVARYGLNLLFFKTLSPFPFATFFINVTGSFLIGFLFVLFTEVYDAGENLKLALTVGFLGAYTTFSTFEFETFALMREKQITVAILYVALSFAVGLVGVLAGVWLARKI
jgi:fluoride exporter